MTRTLSSRQHYIEGRYHWMTIKVYWNISVFDPVFSGSETLHSTRPARARPWVPWAQPEEVEWLLGSEPRLSPRSDIVELVLSSRRSHRKTACAVKPEALGSRCAMVSLPSLPVVNAAERTYSAFSRVHAA